MHSKSKPYLTSKFASTVWNERRVQRDDLEGIRREAYKTRLETLTSTKEMVFLFDECEDAGINSLVSLKHQGAQLRNVGNTLHHIHNGLEHADKTMVKIETNERVCGSCWYPCLRRLRKRRASDIREEKATENLWHPLGPPRVEIPSKRRLKETDDLINSNLYIQQPGEGIGTNREQRAQLEDPTPSKPKTDSETEAEIENNLNKVAGMVKSLKNVAVEVGKELGTQNEELDTLNLKTSSNVRKVAGVTKRVNILL